MGQRGYTKGEVPAQLLVMFETGILFSVLSAIVILIYISMLFLYIRGGGRWIGKTTTMGLLLFSTLVLFNADMILGKDEQEVYVTYSIVKNIVFILIFCYVPYFFEKTSVKHHQIGYHYEGIGYFTIPLTILLFIGEIGASATRYHIKDMSWKYLLVAIVPAIQKLFQCLLYHLLVLPRQHPSIENIIKRKGAKLWLLVMAIYNLSMWIQSLVEEVYGQDNLDRGRYMWGKTSVEQTYYAVIIDYRLLWFLIFLENAYNIHCENDSNQDEPPETNADLPTVRSRWITVKQICFGVVPGILIFCVQFFNIPKSIAVFGADVHTVGIITEVLLIAFACLAFWMIGLRSFPFQQTNRGFDMMVAMLGVCGCLFWILKAFLLTIWTFQAPEEDHYLFSWFAGKFWIRAFACIFHIYLYMYTDVSLTHCPRFRTNLSSHISVPLLCGFYAAVFINSVTDNVNETIAEYLESSGIHVTPKWIYRAGGPIYLGFILHLVIHYFMLTIKLLPYSLISIQCVYAARGRNREDNSESYGIGGVGHDGGIEFEEERGRYKHLQQQVSVVSVT